MSLNSQDTGSKDTGQEPPQTVRTASTRWDSVGPPILVVLLAAVAGALDAPWPVATPLTVAAGTLTVRQCVRHRGMGWLDALAAGVGGALVAIILVGMLLNLFPGGLSRWSWTGAMACTAIAALLFTHHRHPQPPRPPRRFRRPRPLTVMLYALAGMLVASAAAVSAISSRAGPAPDLALAVREPPAASSPWASVIVSASTTHGPLQLLLDQGHGPHPLGSPFTVAAGQPHRATVPASDGTRVTVSVANVGDPVALRRVVIDRSRPASIGAR
jgi:hypothetical protein